MMPTNVAARMTLAADPDSLQGAVAAGILGGGPVVLGTAEECARLLGEAQARVAGGRRRPTSPASVARAIRASGGKVPGFGHPVHKPLDPRAERILELADARGVERAARPARAVPARRRRRSVGQAADDERLAPDRGGAARSRLPVVDREGDADPRAYGRASRASRRGAASGRSASSWRRGRRRRSRTSLPTTGVMLDPESRRGPGKSSSRSTTRLPRPARVPARALGVLPRQARRGRGRPAQDAGGLAEIAQLPLTEKHELRETATPDDPIGAHLCATREEIVRIYSTSGTTGTRATSR